MFNRNSFSCGDEKVLEMVVVVLLLVIEQYECTECHGTINLRTVKMIDFMLYVFYHNKKVQHLKKGD